jgi:hypothetical protein
MEVSGQYDAPAVLPLGKDPGIHSVEGWVGLIAGRDVWEKSLLPLLGFEPRTVQPVADYAISVAIDIREKLKLYVLNE